MLTRILTALVGIPLALLLVFWPGGWVFGGAVLLFTIVAVTEVVRMYSNDSTGVMLRPNPVLAAVGIVDVGLIYLQPALNFSTSAIPVLAIGLILSILWELPTAATKTSKRITKNLALGLFAGFYVGYLYAFLILLRRVEGQATMAGIGTVELGAALVFLVLATVWVGDSLAYFVGRSIGKRPLAPEISPHKTVEGAIANLIGSVIFALLVALWIGLAPVHGVVIGLIVGVFGQMGDLFESLIKREAGAKDSGGLLPGHGGVLDRFDSLMFAAPLVYYYLLFSGALGA